MEKKDERVQGKDKGNFGVSLQLRQDRLGGITDGKKVFFLDMANCHVYPLNSERTDMSLILPKSMPASSDQCTENIRIRTF